MKDLIKKQTDMIRKESGMNVKEELLNEIPGSVVRFRQWQEHIRSLDKLFTGAHWAVKAIPHKKKEAREIQKLTQKLKNLVEIIAGQVVDM